MYSFLDYQFWLYFLTTYIAIGISIFLPGHLILSQLKIKSKMTSVVLAASVGLVLWTLQGYIFGFAELRFLTYGYVGIACLMALLKWKDITLYIAALINEIKSFDRLALILIIIGVIVQCYPVFGSGMRYENGVRFFHVNGTDGVLHLGYIQSMIRSFPPIEPGITAPLVNYHYWSDLAISELARVWRLPIIHLFFQYIPPLISIITAAALYRVILELGGNVNARRWGLFLLFFAGDGAYLFILWFHHYLSFRSPALDNGVTQFLNMPHAMAKMIFITSLIPFVYWIRTNEKKWEILTFFLWVTLIGFKVYYAIFVAIGIVCLLGHRAIGYVIKVITKKLTLSSIFKKEYFSFGLMLIYGAVQALIFFPPNRDSGGLHFAPSQWMLIFFEGGSLDIPGVILRRNAYWDMGNIGMAGIFELAAVFITLVSIYGSRVFGMLPGKKIRLFGIEVLIFFVPGIILFMILGLYTIQESGGNNVYNFFVISAILLALFASFNLSEIQEKKNIFVKIFLIFFVVITIPRVIFEIYNFTILYSKPWLARTVSNQELEGLNYLRKTANPGSIIQTHPNNAWDHDAPYALFFTNTSSYLTGAGLLRTHNQPVDEKSEVLMKAFSASTAREFIQFVRDKRIDYLILQKKEDQNLNFPLTSESFRVIFENDAVTIITADTNE